MSTKKKVVENMGEKIGITVDVDQEKTKKGIVMDEKLIGGLIDQKIVDNEVGNNVKSKDVINQPSKKKSKLKLRPKHI